MEAGQNTAAGAGRMAALELARAGLRQRICSLVAAMEPIKDLASERLASAAEQDTIRTRNLYLSEHVRLQAKADAYQREIDDLHMQVRKINGELADLTETTKAHGDMFQRLMKPPSAEQFAAVDDHYMGGVAA